jgi:hypothetical protein
LSNIRASGLTLNLSKSYFAKPEVKFIGHLVGSGHRRVDPVTVTVDGDLVRLLLKTEDALQMS